MSRKTTQTLTLADRMADAGVDPFWVEQVRTMLRGYSSLRTTCRLLHGDNMALREELGVPQLGDVSAPKTQKPTITATDGPVVAVGLGLGAYDLRDNDTHPLS